jgi:TonB-dependent receptor
MVRFKARDNRYDSYLLRASPSQQEWTRDVNNHTWTLFNPGGTPTDPLNYVSGEDVTAAYAQVRTQIGRLQMVTGARVEHTRFDWETNAPPTVDGRVGNIAYTDVLPSLHLKYAPSQRTNYRLAYFGSISRPSFFEVVPYQIIEEDFWERGNPNLRRTRANNVDARYEHYPSMRDQVMVGLFYKRIVDPIETALAIEGQRIYLQPNNFGTATNFGLEIDFTRYFRQFGIRGFYTYTNSSITTAKIFRFRDDAGSLTSREEQQTRPLQGQSPHIGNVSLLYKNAATGTDVQLAGSFTGRRIIGVSPYFENDIWQRDLVQMDLSVEQRVFGQARLYLKVNNLLDTPLRADILRPNTANPHQVPYEDVSETVKVREDFYGRTFLTGIKVTL